MIVVMVSSNHVRHAGVVHIPTCTGYTIVNISLSNLYFSDDSFYLRIHNDSYRQKDLIHTQTYYMHSTSTGTVIAQRQSLKLCNPFLLDSTNCDEYLTYRQDDFAIQDPEFQTLVLLHSGQAYTSGQYWMLPDRSVVICNSKSNTNIFPEIKIYGNLDIRQRQNNEAGLYKSYIVLVISQTSTFGSVCVFCLVSL